MARRAARRLSSRLSPRHRRRRRGHGAADTTEPARRRSRSLASRCVAFAVAAARAQQRLARFAANPTAVGAEQAADQRALLATRVDAELATLREAADRARRLAADGAPICRGSLERIIGGPGSPRRARGARRHASRRGRGRCTPTRGRSTRPSGVVSTPFGLTLYAASDSGGVRAVAASLLYASPPADRLARGLAQRMPGSEVTEGFVFTAPTDSAGPDALRYSDAGRPLFVARAIVPSVDEVRFRHARAGPRPSRCGAAHRARGAPRRGVAPRGGCAGDDRRGARRAPMHRRRAAQRVLDSFAPVRRVRVLPSRGTRVHVERGRADAHVRDAAPRRAARRAARAARSAAPRRARRSRSSASCSGPYLVRTLSRGIAPPAEGAGVALWLIWEVPLCLAATTVLVLAAWGGRAALTGRRSVDTAAAPALAMLAAIVAPLVWMAPGRWPRVVRRCCGSPRSERSSRRVAVATGSSRRRRSPRSAPLPWCGGRRRAVAWSSPSATCAGSPVPTRPPRRFRIASRRG